jgi:hypothetical protein
MAWFGIGVFELLIVAVMLGVPFVVAVIVLIVVLNKRNQLAASGNLVPCPDCHQAVSRRAQTCPHCGCPLTSKP